MTPPATVPDARLGVVDQIPAAIIAVDLEHRVILWSRGAVDLYGWSAEQALGRPVRELFLQGQQRTDVIASTHAGQVWEGEMHVVHRDGHPLHVFVRNAPLRGEDGAIRGVLGASLDVTALRTAEVGRAGVVAQLAVTAARAAARTERLQRLTSALVPARTVVEVAEAVVRTGIEAVGAAAGGLTLVGGDGQELVLIASQGFGAATVEAFRRVRLADPMPVTDVVRSGEPALFVDQQAWLRAYPGLPDDGVGARAAIPVSASGTPMGALALSFAEPRDFDDLDVELLMTIGRQCGQAVERARLLVAERATSRRNAFLAGAAGLLARSLDPAATLTTLVTLLVPDFADWGTVHLVEADRTVAQVAAHRDPEAAAALSAAVVGTVLDISAPGGTAEAVRTGRSVLHAQIPPEVRARIVAPPPLAELSGWLAPVSGVSVPLVFGGRVTGAITLARTGGEAFGAADVALLEEVASRAAVALSHARDYERERDSALTLQRSLLPQSLPDVPGLDFDWRYLPGAEGALVGGDWYDVLPLPHGRVAVVIGDVMGSGVTAAAVMGQLRAMARAYTEAGVQPGELLARLDSALRRLEQESITTLLYAVVDPATRVAILASAGHLPPLLCPQGGSPDYLELTPGPPLGAGPGLFPETRTTLPEGSTLLLYTDGLVEDRHQTVEQGMQRLRSSVAERGPLAPSQLCDLALAATRRDAGRADDTALLAVALVTPELSPFHTGGLTSSRDLPRLRREVARCAAPWHLPGELLDDLLVVLSELCSNALLHSGGAVTATVRLEADRVRVEVADSSPQDLPLPSLDALTRARGRLQDSELDAVIDSLTETATTGRGMTLIERLASRWGVDVHPVGKVVWAELDLGGHAVVDLADTPDLEGVAIRIRGVPVRLILSSAALLDELLREFVVAPDERGVDILGSEGAALLVRTARTREPFRAAAREALARGQRLVDVQSFAAREDSASLSAFTALLDRLAALAAQGHLLASAPGEEVIAFRAWWAAEIAAQVAGKPPSPCPFPALPPS